MRPRMKELVRLRYGTAAEAVERGGSACCADDCCPAPVAQGHYQADLLAGLPVEAVRASMGSGSPIARAALRSGEMVLDLGSGGGLDALIAARLVGPAGRVYGLDTTPEMLALARANQRRAGIDNVEFLHGDIEAVPLPDASVDAIVSNCVINLSTDKDRVFREAFRVLRPGGRLVVSDVVARTPLPAAVRQDLGLWSQCVAGALGEREYREGLEAARFEHVTLEATRVYEVPEVGVLATALIRAAKPLRAPRRSSPPGRNRSP